MQYYDFRFDVTFISKWLGKTFEKYRCDEFDFTNSVTQIVGISIDDEFYKLSNQQELVDYFGTTDDVSVYRIRKADESEIKSTFENIKQIDTPIKESISEITLVNENQQIFIENELKYDVWLTRAICFRVGEREVLFEKDCVPFSEEIIIRRGYELLNRVQTTDDFLEGWEDGIIPKIKREIVVLK